LETLNRRQVLKLAGLALASHHLNSSTRALGSPARAAAFPALPALPLTPAEPGVVEAELTAAWTNVSVAGVRARLLTYNGSFPGPVLRVREGERVRLRFTNDLGEPTNLHFHGLHVPPSIDNPFLAVAPGDTVTYELTIPTGSAGTYWYHPHLHGHVARQLFAGLAGVIVIEGPLDSLARLRRAEEYVLVLKDLTLVDGAPAAHLPVDWFAGKEGELLLVNGALQPVLAPRRGTLRLRLLNASNARYYRLHLEGHPLYLIATDGGFLAAPVGVDELLLAPGERAEVMVQLTRAGSFRLVNLPYDRGGGHMMGSTGMMGGMTGGPVGGNRQTQTLLTIAAPADPKTVPLPSRLARLDPIDAPLASISRLLVLGGGMMGMQFFINGRSFDENRVDFHGRSGDVEIWEIRNRSTMDHPFHLHTYPFQVLSRNDVAEPFVAWKDVVNVRPGQSVRIAVPLRDFTGKTIFHCHIVEHEDQGMMGVLEV
jgi:FtsP/CotA-like multicopper oxidase with cupredoxin domain